jgi:hypothetical protein
VLQSLNDAAAWLNATPAHDWARDLLRGERWLSPTIQSIHIVGVAVVVGSAGMLNLRLLGWAVPSQTPAEMARRLMPWMGWALAVQLATGGLLILNRPARYFENGAFLAKLAMLVVAVALTALLAGRTHGAPRGPDRLLAAIALIAWVGVILAGRWIAYV